MSELQSEFNSSWKDLEKAKDINDSLNSDLKKCQAQVKALLDEKDDLFDSISDKENQYNNIMQEVEIRELEKEKIIDHIKKQAENTVAFYRNKYERMIRERK